MDSLTHIVMGAAIGELTLGKQQGRRALLWGAVAGSFPDLDVLFHPLFSASQNLLFHRGVSHSILIWLILAPLLALLINKIYKGNKADYKGWLRLTMLAWLSHIFIDMFNTYGTAVFAPFSNYRVAIDSMSIFDIFFFMPFFISALFSIFYRMKKIDKDKINRRVRKFAAIACVVSTLYFSYTFYNCVHVRSIVKTQLAEQHISYNRILTSTVPLTNFMWLVLAEDDHGFWMGNYTLNLTDDITFSYIPKNEELGEAFKNTKAYKQLEFFSKDFYTLTEKEDGVIVFSDLRFAGFEFYGASTEQQPVLNVELTEDSFNHLKVKKTRLERKASMQNLKNYVRMLLDHKKMQG